MSNPDKEAAAIEVENRLATIFRLWSRGLTQGEIAGRLGMSQSTVSRDIKKVRSKAQRQLTISVTEDIPLELGRYRVMTDDVMKKCWDMIEDKETADRNKLAALSMIMQCNIDRVEMLYGENGLGTESKDYAEFLEDWKKYSGHHDKVDGIEHSKSPSTA